MQKTCTTCLIPKDVSEFWVSRSGRTKDGYKNECKECAKLRRRVWGSENRDREREYNHAKYLGDPEGYSESAAQWREDNPDRYREIHRMGEQTRRARKKDAFIENVDPSVVYEMHGGMCGICEDFVPRDDFHVDHIVPLAKGGMHGYINVQPAHPFCNLSKGAKV